jgi:hypothetical protein
VVEEGVEVLVAFAESILPRLRQKRHRRSTRDNGWDSEGYNCSLSMWIYGAFSRSMALVYMAMGRYDGTG